MNLRGRPEHSIAGSELAAQRLPPLTPAGTAVDALLDVRAESLQLGGSELLVILQGPEPVMDHLAGAGVTALLDLALVELLGVFPEGVARRHGWLPVALVLGYQ